VKSPRCPAAVKGTKAHHATAREEGWEGGQTESLEPEDLSTGKFPAGDKCTNQFSFLSVYFSFFWQWLLPGRINPASSLPGK
jgi:hypothetical protein